MEPMALGSPGSPLPSTGASNFLPSFLLDEPVAPVTPRKNTLSPIKGRTLAFAQSPGISSPPENSRSMYAFQQSSPPTKSFNPVQHNSSMSGPPTQELFDSLRAEQNSLNMSRVSQMPNPLAQHNRMPPFTSPNSDSFMNRSNLDTSRQNASFAAYGNYAEDVTPMYQHQNSFAQPKHCGLWITVFGFSQTSIPTILSHFSQCGTIIDKNYSPQNGNWLHIKYSSRLECDKALNYNEKILNGNIMIGVTKCKESSLLDKENYEKTANSTQPLPRVRPLTHIAYQNAQSPTDVALQSPSMPKRSTGLVNKAMDLFFGW